jgi:hypothetical protein
LFVIGRSLLVIRHKGSAMLDFTPLRNRKVTMAELTADLTPADLRQLTHEMIDAILALIADCDDAAVTFVPEDPDAHDAYAADSSVVDLAWTLGHVIAHVTASSEESAFLAAELARGVPFEKRRSRSEVPWESVTTIAQCRHRLEESRRMRLASLDLWPDEPYLDNVYYSRPDGPPVNAVGRFVYGLVHDDDHLGQIAEIVRQAAA